MRALVTLCATVAVLSLLSLDQPERARAFQRYVSSALARSWYDKEIWISGTMRVDRRELERLLPQEESVLSWNLHLQQLGALLRAHPLVQDATVERCSDAWWGCFSIRVLEREPFLVAVVGKRGWVIGADGGVMTPLPGTWGVEKSTEKSVDSTRGAAGNPPGDVLQLDPPPAHLAGRDLPVVEGLGDEHESPDALRVRFAQAIRVVRVLGDALQREVTRIRFEPGREMRVQFAATPWRVVFDISGDERWEERLQEQSARLVALIEQHPEQLENAEQVDLAFERIAVVRYASAPL